MLWPTIILGNGLTYLAKQAKWVALAAAFLAWLTGFIKACITDTIARLSGFVDQINMENFQNVSFAAIEYVGYVNAFFPISEFVTLMVAYLVGWVTVILIRWLKSFIPTIAN